MPVKTPLEYVGGATTTLPNGINDLQTNGKKAAKCVTFVMTLGQKRPRELTKLLADKK